MKRSLTIGCVLLAGGAVANCGGVVTGTGPAEETGDHAGASGSGAAAGASIGDYVGAGGAQIGVIV